MSVLIEAFLLGLVYGFGPCTVSCAPVLVPIVMSTSKNTKQGLYFTLLFGLGRILVYILLAMIMAAIGRTLDVKLPTYALGIVFILLGLALFFKIHTRCILPKTKITGPWMSFAAGIIMGFSPCAPLLGILALAATSKSVLISAGMAIAFGIATLISPLLIIGLLSGKWASLKEFHNINNYISGIFMCIIGLLYLFQ